MSKVLGIDYGEKRIGLALSDVDAKYAFNYQTLENNGTDSITALRDICQKESISTIVIGLPLNQKGEDGPSAVKVREFAKALEQETQATVVFEDERFSSVLAAVLLRQAGKKAHQTRAVIDQHSAHIILQTYLDRHHG